MHQCDEHMYGEGLQDQDIVGRGRTCVYRQGRVCVHMMVALWLVVCVCCVALGGAGGSGLRVCWAWAQCEVARSVCYRQKVWSGWLVEAGDRLRVAGQYVEAVEVYMEAFAESVGCGREVEAVTRGRVGATTSAGGTTTTTTSGLVHSTSGAAGLTTLATTTTSGGAGISSTSVGGVVTSSAGRVVVTTTPGPSCRTSSTS